jgi:hypothetical protein
VLGLVDRTRHGEAVREASHTGATTYVSHLQKHIDLVARTGLAAFPIKQLN